MARHVFHWKHGWIPLDHEAISHGGHRSQATGPIKGDRRPPAGHPIRTRRDVAKAVTTLRNVPAADRHRPAKRTASSARHAQAEDLLPPALARLNTDRPSLSTADVAAFGEHGDSSAFAHLEPDGRGGFRFTAERHALHQKIIEDTLKGASPAEHPAYNVLGGGPASGKSTVVATQPELSRNTATINPDDVRLRLPEYDQHPPATRSSFTHEEASYIAKAAISEGFNRRLNITLDGTGDSSPESLRGKIAAAREHGYSVHGYYVTIPTEEAVARANARGERTGRFVPEHVIRGTHANVSATLPKVLDEFDSLQIYDNTNGPVQILDKAPGGSIDVLDQVLYQQFLDKGGPAA